jgi:hypothetical protein
MRKIPKRRPLLTPRTAYTTPPSLNLFSDQRAPPRPASCGPRPGRPGPRCGAASPGRGPSWGPRRVHAQGPPKPAAPLSPFQTSLPTPATPPRPRPPPRGRRPLPARQGRLRLRVPRAPRRAPDVCCEPDPPLPLVKHCCRIRTRGQDPCPAARLARGGRWGRRPPRACAMSLPTRARRRPPPRPAPLARTPPAKPSPFSRTCILPARGAPALPRWRAPRPAARAPGGQEGGPYPLTLPPRPLPPSGCSPGTVEVSRASKPRPAQATAHVWKPARAARLARVGRGPRAPASRLPYATCCVCVHAWWPRATRGPRGRGRAGPEPAAAAPGRAPRARTAAPLDPVAPMTTERFPPLSASHCAALALRDGWCRRPKTTPRARAPSCTHSPPKQASQSPWKRPPTPNTNPLSP